MDKDGDTPKPLTYAEATKGRRSASPEEEEWARDMLRIEEAERNRDQGTRMEEDDEEEGWELVRKRKKGGGAQASPEKRESGARSKPGSPSLLVGGARARRPAGRPGRASPPPRMAEVSISPVGDGGGARELCLGEWLAAARKTHSKRKATPSPATGDSSSNTTVEDMDLDGLNLSDPQTAMDLEPTARETSDESQQQEGVEEQEVEAADSRKTGEENGRAGKGDEEDGRDSIELKRKIEQLEKELERLKRSAGGKTTTEKTAGNREAQGKQMEKEKPGSIYTLESPQPSPGRVESTLLQELRPGPSTSQ